MSGGVALVYSAECWERKSQFTRGSVFGKKMSARELVLKTELLTCGRFFFLNFFSYRDLICEELGVSRLRRRRNGGGEGEDEDRDDVNDGNDSDGNNVDDVDDDNRKMINTFKRIKV